MVIEAGRVLHLVVFGKVQGVWYRASAAEKANELGLSGWVRNLPGGEVEIKVDGAGDLLEQFVAWCQKGPPAAEVVNVEVEEVVEPALPLPFEIRRG